MGVYVTLDKQSEDDTSVRYRFADVDGPARFLVLDKVAETIFPEDGNRNILFRAAAGKLARAWGETGEASQRLIRQS